MSENYLKHYEMELIILSPVYIGSGEKIGKKEYIFLPLKKRVLVPDLGKMYTALMKKRADWEYQEYMLEDTPIPLGIWLKDHKFTMQDYQSWTKYEMNSGDALLGNGGKQGRTHEIQCFIKDAYGMPYIPGSSIKGMIRSALLAYEVKKNPKKYENIKQDILSNIGNKASRTKFFAKRRS